MAPLKRNPFQHALYLDEANTAGLKASGIQPGAPGVAFTMNKFTFGAVHGQNPLFASPDPSPKLMAGDDRAGNYSVFVPQAVVQNCINAATRQSLPPPLKVTLFFSPFGGNPEMFTCGLRGIFDNRANDQRVLISIPGNEALGQTTWGIGITKTQIKDLLKSMNADYSTPQISVLAAWSAGYKGMLATMRAVGRLSDLPDLDKVEKVVFFDCLYFTGDSKGLVDDGLGKIGKSSAGGLQVVAYLVTPGGNDSLNPADVLQGIPFIKNNSLAPGLIPIIDANRFLLRKIVLVRALAWALQEGAIAQNELTPPLVRACAAIAGTKRNTVRSIPSLPFGKAIPAGSVDLQTFARVSQNAPIQMLSVADVNTAMSLVKQGQMIFFGNFPDSMIDHMVLMPELAWEFIAG